MPGKYYYLNKHGKLELEGVTDTYWERLKRWYWQLREKIRKKLMGPDYYSD